MAKAHIGPGSSGEVKKGGRKERGSVNLGQNGRRARASHHLPLKAPTGLEEIPHHAGV